MRNRRRQWFPVIYWEMLYLSWAGIPVAQLVKESKPVCRVSDWVCALCQGMFTQRCCSICCGIASGKAVWPESVPGRGTALGKVWERWVWALGVSTGVVCLSAAHWGSGWVRLSREWGGFNMLLNHMREEENTFGGCREALLGAFSVWRYKGMSNIGERFSGDGVFWHPLASFCVPSMHMEHTDWQCLVFWLVKSVPLFFSSDLLTDWLIWSQCCKTLYHTCHICLSHLLGEDPKNTFLETNVKRRAADTLSLAENLCSCCAV